MTTPTGWAEAAADIIARDGDPEEPPPFVSGHDAFLQAQAVYEGRDPETVDE